MCPSRRPLQAAASSSSSSGPCSVDRWLDVLRSVDGAGAAASTPCARLQLKQQQLLRAHLEELLIAHPEAVKLSPEDVAGVARLLYDATAQQRLYTQWWWPADVVLDLAVTWGPDQLGRALGALQRAADASFDGLVSAGDLLAACAPHVQPLLAADTHQALTRKARLLKERVPEFTPGTVIRACPEVLLRWQEWEIETGVVRAGDVVVLGQGEHLAAELVLTPSAIGTQQGEAAAPLQPHQQQQHVQGPGPGSAAAPPGAPQSSAAPGSTRRVMRRRWDADSLAQRALPGSCVKVSITHPGGAAAGEEPCTPHVTGEHQQQEEQEEVLCVLTNTRQLIYVCNRLVEVRFMDPFRQEEALLAAGGAHASQCYTPRSWLLWPGGMGAGTSSSSSAQSGALAAGHHHAGPLGAGLHSTTTPSPSGTTHSSRHSTATSATAPPDHSAASPAPAASSSGKKCMFAPVR